MPRNTGLEMSLDDIIRNKNKKKPRGQKKNIRPTQLNKISKVKKENGHKVMDARNKIILKNRTKIVDARDKLAAMAKQKDARVKLEQLRLKRTGKPGLNRNLNKNKGLPTSLKTRGKINLGLFSDITRQVHTSPMPRMSGYPSDVSMAEYMPSPKPIIRSINNHMTNYSPRIKKPISLRDKMVLRDNGGFNLKIVARNDIQSINGSNLNRMPRKEEAVYASDDSLGSPVSILKKRPVGGGLDREMFTSAVMDPPRSEEFRIVVSNLRNTVTGADIQELFGDIGDLVESRLVRPGTAEVIYGSLKDAQKAVDVYHNRQLDGQPMKCFLVNPRNPPAGIKNDAVSRLGSPRPGKPLLPASSNSAVVPDISTFHKVLFRKH